MIEIGDEVVHQSHPGRFTVIAVRERKALNVYSNHLTLRSAEGLEITVLESSVRKLAPREAAG